MKGGKMIANRLKLFRRAKGMSLDELSAAMDRLVSKQAISKYEKGNAVPSARVIVALADALGVSPARLMESDQIEVTTLAYRKKSSLGAKERERLESVLICHLQEAMRLRELVSPNSILEIPVRALEAKSIEEAELRADQLRGKWGLGEEPLATVVDVLEEQGISVCIQDADGKFDGLSAVARNKAGEARGAAVLCRAGLSRERQRLNLAHELAHVVLMPAEGLDEEAAAWRFAGAFLAPRERLIADVGESRQSISIDELLLLKRRYGMSMQALIMRMNTLGVLSDDSKRQYFIMLSKNGMRINEPGDSEDSEQPQWFRRSTLRAVSEGVLTSREATSLLGEQVHPVEGDRNRFVRLLASMSPESRLPFLSNIEFDESDVDSEWQEANLDDMEGLDVS